MPVKTVFIDDDDNELDCYLNDEGKVVISVKKAGDQHTHSRFIALEKEDVGLRIKFLKEIEQQCVINLNSSPHLNKT